MKKLIFLFLGLWSLSISSQTLFSVLEKKTIALAEPNTYKIRIENLGGQNVELAPRGELLPFHFEEITDSIAIQADHYERLITFTVFEEGTFTLPAFEVKVGDKVLKTIPYTLEVVNTAQKGDQIHDIMKNREVKLNMKDYWELYKFYILGLLALLAIIFLIYQFLRYGKRQKDSPKVRTNQTLKALSQLKKKQYIEKGNYRLFYVELIDISRAFLSSQFKIPADVLLTEDLLDLIHLNQTVSSSSEAILKEVFTRGDLVKFAKIFPDKEVMTKDYDSIVHMVKESSKDLEFENLRKDV